MNAGNDQIFLTELLKKEGIEYAVFSEDGALVEHSHDLAGYLMTPQVGSLTGKKLNWLFPELIGFEESLAELYRAPLEPLQIERVHRSNLFGEGGYVTLKIWPFNGGWLVSVRNASLEGELEQKITQQRNELSLLSGKLAQTQAQLDDMLRRFVPTAVVDTMLIDDEKTRLGGERREITVMFADIRGFTRWAEQHDPEKVMDVLNNALLSAVNILLENGATLDKFMGDALMAIFNAPLAQDDHASRALKCAELICKDQDPDAVLHFGIGINTGYAVVGNVGTQDAMNYTALGDAVNIAKRLEELTYPGQILIGQRTHELANQEIDRVSFGRVKLRGRQKPIAVYEMVCKSQDE